MARRKAKCWKCGNSMYRDEMVKIFAHGLQNGYKGKSHLTYGNDVVVCPSCVPDVKEKNKEGNMIAIAIGVVGFIIALFIAIVQRG